MCVEGDSEYQLFVLCSSNCSPRIGSPSIICPKARIPCSTPGCDIYILNKIARWCVCSLMIEKHYPQCVECVRNIPPFSDRRYCLFGGWEDLSVLENPAPKRGITHESYTGSVCSGICPNQLTPGRKWPVRLRAEVFLTM